MQQARAPRLALQLAPLFLAACGDPGGSDTAWYAEALDEVSGQYQVFIEEYSVAADCADQLYHVTDWAQGPLTVAGASPVDLEFTFRDDMSFPGAVDESLSYHFGGGASWDGATLSVSHSGVFLTEDDQRVLSGSFQVQVDDDEFSTNDCVIEARIRGTRISGR